MMLEIRGLIKHQNTFESLQRGFLGQPIFKDEKLLSRKGVA